MLRTALALLALLSVTPAAAEERRPVDVALVLALDVSGSVSEDAWKIQRDGVAGAIASGQFARTVRQGQIGRIAVAVVQWGTMPRLVVGWQVVETPDEIQALASKMRSMRRAESGGTCMGTALHAIIDELADWEDIATRRIVDISGDGASNCGRDLGLVRTAALQAGITINGLPIITSLEPQVADWYADNVVGGPGSFVTVADGNGGFAEAFLRKLTIEVASLGP